MKSNGNSLAVTLLAACAVFVSALSAINAQTLQKGPDNPAFLQYQQKSAQKMATAKNISGYGRGYVPPPVDLSYLRGRSSAWVHAPKALPLSYDLRTQGKLTPVKNQNPWGTCWAFATYSSLESTLMPSEERYFSVNNMVNNHGFDSGYDEGGDAAMSTAYLTRWSGPINEVDDPYTNGPGHSPSNLPAQKHVQEVLFLPLKAAALDNTTIKEAVMNYGATYVAMFYDDPSYNSTNASYYYNGTNDCNHAIAIVGWDDNYPATNFIQTPSGNGAYIVRNSWGTNWGDNGYFYCSYYDSLMGFDENVAFNNGEAVTNYGSVYQYDPLGWVQSCGYRSMDAWGANIFTATNTEVLRAAGFYTTDIDVNYELYVYANVVAGNPASGTRALIQTGSISQCGYHTVDFNTSVNVSSGQLFSVVIRFINSAYQYPIAYEYARSNYSSRATSSPGQSYVSYDGASWMDLTTYDATANVCIKAFCNPGSGNVPDPHVSITGDIDGDGKADLISVVGADWYFQLSTDQYQVLYGPYDMGIAGSTPVAGFIDNDQLSDLISVVGANWFIRLSTDQYRTLFGPYDMGIAGSTPVAGFIDNDQLSDLISVVGANWFIRLSTAQYQGLYGPYQMIVP